MRVSIMSGNFLVTMTNGLLEVIQNSSLIIFRYKRLVVAFPFLIMSSRSDQQIQNISITIYSKFSLAGTRRHRIMAIQPIISKAKCSVRCSVRFSAIYAIPLLLLMTLAPFPAVAKEVTIVGKSGYPVPRYVTLASNTVNVRTGPDGKYPILWIFKKAGLPIKVIAEYKDWRKIIDSEGESGWIWGPLLSSKRNGLIVASPQTLLKEPSEPSLPAVIAEAGVIGKIKKCADGWCQLDVNGFKGWLRQSQFWGTLEGETFD